MKRIIVLAIFFIAFSSNISFADGFEKIHKVNLSKDQIHNAVIEWIATTFNDPSSVIKMNDKAGGKIIVKGLVDVPVAKDNPSFKSKCEFKAIFSIKENKYKISYRDFIVGDHYFFIDSPDTRMALNESLYNATMYNIPIVLMRMDDSLFEVIKQYKKSDNW